MPKDNKDKKHSKKDSKSEEKIVKKRDKKSDKKEKALIPSDKEKVRKSSNVSATSAESLQSKTTRSKSEGTVATKSEGETKLRKSEQRAVDKQNWKDNINAEKKYLEEKYDINLRDSDDSSDEENLLRNGNVPEKWYDLYDHKGYSIDGKTVGKMLEKDELQKFVEKSEDPQWWRNITDHLNNKEIRLSRGDLEMI